MTLWSATSAEPAGTASVMPLHFVKRQLLVCLSSEVTIVRALFDFAAIQHDDLSFRKGDRMVLVNDQYVVVTFALSCRVTDVIHVSCVLSSLRLVASRQPRSL